MRAHLEILEEIGKVFTDYGLETERVQLEHEISAGSTGGEICSRCGSKLLEFQKQNKQVALSAGSLIDEFITYCNKNGILFKKNEF